jgi:hypothetical protein
MAGRVNSRPIVGDDEEPVLGALERILRLGLGDPVEVGLGVLDPAVADGAGEGDEGPWS